MKALFFSTLALIISVNAFSQDTLFTRNGEVILGKVYEITQTEIKYKKPSNPDGPLYTISKDDITLIEYKNGSKDVFQYSGQADNSGTSTTAGNANTSTQQPQVNNYYSSTPRPSVNVVLGAGYGFPFWGGWGYRSYYRPYRYYGGYGGWGGYHHGGWGGHHGHGHHR